MSVKADSEDKAHKHNARVGRMLTKELDTQRDMERMHLQTIRKEKIRLQKELERVRTKGQYMVQRKPASKNKRLLQTRFNSQSSVDSDKGLNIEAEQDVSRSPSVARKAYTVSTNTGLPRLSAGLDNEAFPMESEYRSRANGYDSYIHRKQLNQQKQRMELAEEKNSLNARIEEFTRSLTPQKPTRTSPPDGLTTDATYEEILPLGDKDSAQSTSSSVSNGSFKQQRKKSRQMTIADYDVTQAKHSVAKRLLSDGSDNNGSSDHSKDDVVVPPLRANRKIFRRSTQVAMLDRDQVNKYSQDNNESEVTGHNSSKETKIQGTKDNPTRENELQMSMKGVGASTRRQVLEIIENPEFKFDEEKYAPDGELRTVHMLPDTEDAFEEAKHARYLRWRDPKEMARERELSIGAIFAKDERGNYVSDIPDEEGLSDDEN